MLNENINQSEQTESVLKLAINRAAIEATEESEQSKTGLYRAPFSFGTETGFWETNSGFSTGDFYGGVYEAGLYGQMRTAHDIIAANFDYRKAAVAGLDYRIAPRSENPTNRQCLAAEAVSLLFKNMAGGNLNSFIANTYDSVGTYGSSLYEIWIPTEGEGANRLHLQTIPAQQIAWYNYRPDNRDSIQSVEITSGDNIYLIDGAKLAWFGNKIISGNFWGISDLRKVVALFLAYQEDLKNYLALRRLQKGILYFQENEQGTSKESWLIAKSFMLQYFNGRSSPLLLPRGMDINHLAADSPGLADYRSMLEYFDQKIKAALDTSLTNLGLNGVGSLALGKEVAFADKEKFVAHVDSFIQKLNDPEAPGNDLLKKLTAIAGFDPKTETPQIEVVNNTAVRVVDQIDMLIKLLDKGIVTADMIELDTVKQMFVELGLGVSKIDELIKLDDNPGKVSLASISKLSAIEADYVGAEDPVDMTPTKEMREAAKQGLEIRASVSPSNRGGTDVGIARARDIQNGKRLPLETWKRVFSFISRHEPTWKEQKAKLSDADFKESKINQAILLWGGIGAGATAKRIIDAHDEAIRG